MQVKRRDFTSASASKNSVGCSVHFRLEDYHPSDMMEFNMGCRSKNQVRLRAGAVPSVHSASPSGPPTACGSAAGGKHDGHASVRDAARRKRGLCTVSLFFFLTFANYKISEHNDFNNEKQRDVYKLQRTAASL